MAERRMFAKTITESDAFLDLPHSAQVLYLHLCMEADDEGFVNSIRKITRMAGCTDEDIDLLISKKFVLSFGTGVLCVKHWLIHNQIRKDRMTATKYTEEKAMLYLKENGAYTLQPTDNHLSTSCQPSDNQVTTNCQPNDGIDKNSIGKYRVDKNRNDIMPTYDDSNNPPFNEERFNELIERRNA